MELKFRKLNADEIDVRIGSINKGGVVLLLYKDARVDQNILDETVTPTNWQRHHSRDNANCVVAIWDEEKSQWIEKEDTGCESFSQKEKGLASDSFKRACVNWGIGRELYTAPNIFVPKENLKSYSVDGDKYTCYDEFEATEITYSGDVIASVTIAIKQYGKTHHTMTFTNKVGVTPTTQPTSKANHVTNPKPPASNPSPVSSSDNAATIGTLAEDEVLLIGNCRGHKYGEVKGTEAFKSFLNWVEKSNTSYSDKKQNEQYLKLKKLVSA